MPSFQVLTGCFHVYVCGGGGLNPLVQTHVDIQLCPRLSAPCPAVAISVKHAALGDSCVTEMSPEPCGGGG